MVAVSALVPPSQHLLVRARAARLTRQALPGRWPLAHRPGAGLARRVGVVVAAIAPWLPHRRQGLLARYALWTLLLDDECDRPDASLAQIDRLLGAVTAVVAGEETPAEETPAEFPLAAELAAIVAQLRRCDPTGAGACRLGATLRQAMAAEAQHLRLAHAVAHGHAAPPTAEEYLAVAAHTVHYVSFAYVLLAAARIPANRRFTEALWHAACAVRLSNDLRSVARDRAEGRLNVLSLSTAAGAPVSRPWVHHAIERHLRDHDRALMRLPRGLADAAPTLRRCVRVSVGLYRHSDLR